MNALMGRLGGIFLKGLVAILPIVVTLYLIYWLASLSETILGGLLQSILPVYFPGLGLLLAIAGIFALGLLLNAWLVRRLFDVGEALMQRIPLIKTIYGAVKDLMGFFSGSGEDRASQVVTVAFKVGDAEARLLGLVTREDFLGLPPELGGPDDIAVYLPMSYQIGGFTLMLPRSQVKAVDMSMDRAMRFAVTAGMSTGSNNSQGIRAKQE